MFLLLYMKAIHFCELILYSDTLLKLYIVSRNFLVELLGTHIMECFTFFSNMAHNFVGYISSRALLAFTISAWKFAAVLTGFLYMSLVFFLLQI